MDIRSFLWYVCRGTYVVNRVKQVLGQGNNFQYQPLNTKLQGWEHKKGVIFLSIQKSRLWRDAWILLWNKWYGMYDKNIYKATSTKYNIYEHTVHTYIYGIHSYFDEKGKLDNFVNQ